MGLRHFSNQPKWSRIICTSNVQAISDPFKAQETLFKLAVDGADGCRSITELLQGLKSKSSPSHALLALASVLGPFLGDSHLSEPESLCKSTHLPGLLLVMCSGKLATS